ncbi:MAG: FRG domain-containing protein [Pseudoruegeria sp.]
MNEQSRPSIETDGDKIKREQKRAYLESLPEYPDFALPNDSVDALLPSARVKSWEDLLKILQGSDFKKTKNDLVYRGHAGHDWQLASTLGRLFSGGEIPKDKREKLLRQFKLSMRGRGYDLAPLQSEEEIWAVGQHHGLKTPLLDWTRSPFVALFFAFSSFESEDGTYDNPSRAIFCLNKTKIEEDLGEDFAEELFLEPEDHRNSRLVNQSGLFTVAPAGHDNLVSLIVRRLDENELLGGVDATETEIAVENGTEEFLAAIGQHLSFAVSDRKRAQMLAQYIFKLHIPNGVSARKDCLEALRQMNIHHGNLFPDPGGASDFCNDWLERLLEDEDKEKADAVRKEDDKKIAAAVTSKPKEDVSSDVKTILEAFLSFAPGESDQLSVDIDKAVEEATTIDWDKFLKKRLPVKRAISKVIANGSGELKSSRKPEELIDMLLEKYRAAAKRERKL